MADEVPGHLFGVGCLLRVFGGYSFHPAQGMPLDRVFHKMPKVVEK
jgi:hypothetical protein